MASTPSGLHDDAVWRVVRDLARGWAERGRALTFFVHPFWATAAGADITSRVRELATMGHEIGQHTRYYDRATARRPAHKRGDLSPANVLRRLEEDHGFFAAAGLGPVGFVSGAWAFPEPLVAWLAEKGFHYDCSMRTYAPTTCGTRQRTTAPTLLAPGLLEVPTTAPVSTAARRLLRSHLRSASLPPLSYQLVYCHDDDLVNRRHRLALAALARVWEATGWRVVPCAQVAAAAVALVGEERP